MEKKSILFLLLILFCQSIFCQTKAKIRSVNFEVKENKIIVTYDISNPSPGEVFNIELKFVTGDNKELVPKSTAGDVGTGITGGTQKSITWDVEKDQIEFSGELTAVVTIKSSELPKPLVAEVPAVVRSTDVKAGGPSNAFLSLLLPGLGGHFVEENKIRPVITTVATLGLLGYGIYQKTESNKYYSDYESSANPAIIQDYYDKANNAQHKFFICTGIAAVIWIADIAWVAYRGSKNKKSSGSSMLPSQKDGFRLYYADQHLQVGYSMKF